MHVTHGLCGLIQCVHNVRERSVYADRLQLFIVCNWNMVMRQMGNNEGEKVLEERLYVAGAYSGRALGSCS